MERIFLLLSVIAMVLVIVTGGGVFWASSAGVADAKQGAAVAVAKGIAVGIAAQIDQLNRGLAKMAQDAEVVEVLKNDDLGQIEAAETRLEKYLPGVLKIRLLRPGVNEPDNRSVPHMGFADLDMVRETFEKNQLPAIQGDAGENRHLAMTARVVADNTVIGVILASLNYDFINESLKMAAIGAQFVQLKQAGFKLAESGDQSLKDQADHVTVDVANTPWVVQVWYTKSADASESGLVAGLMIIAVLLVCLAFFVGFRKTSDMLGQDQSSVLKAVKDLMTGNAYGNYPVHFSEMSLIISSLVQFKRVLDQKEYVTEPDQSEDSDFGGFFEESDFTIEELTHEEVEEITRGIPLQRHGRPSDMAGVALYLASPAASYVTGVVIPVDGGITGAKGTL